MTTCIEALKDVSSCALFPYLDDETIAGFCHAHHISKSCTQVVARTQASGEVDLEKSRGTMQKCITWTKKSGKGSNALSQVQEHVGLKQKCLITPVKTRMGTIFVTFRVMLENRLAIDHLYGTIRKRNKDLHARLPSTACWETVKMAHLTMKESVQVLVCLRSFPRHGQSLHFSLQPMC